MEMIFAKTPEMVHKEIWVHLLAYNLLRNLMWPSKLGCRPCGFPCRGLDNSSISSDLIWPGNCQNHHRLYTTLLDVISAHLVPLRPNRAEPRVTKRRPKSFPRMQQPRSVLKAKLTA